MEINLSQIVNVILASLGIAGIVGIVGMILWYRTAFLVGGASAATSLSITIEGESIVV